MVINARYSFIPTVRKIAVLRANALGDLIFALPALHSLKATYPEAEIVLLARAWHRDFLAQRPGPIDRVVVIPAGGIGDESQEGQDPAELEQFFAAMQAEQFDIAMQMHGGGRNSNPFALRLGAKLTIGLRTPDAPPVDRWIPYIYYQSEILRYLELVALVGAQPTALEPHLEVTERDRTEAQSVLPQTHKPLVALHPGATDSRRWWPVEKFAAVGDTLVAAGAEIIVTGTRAEAPLVQAVLEKMQAPAHNLCGQLSLNGLTGILDRCNLLISNDSGPLHLAAAIGTATVGVYWCGNVITAAPLMRTHHRPAISWRLHCPVCGLDCTQEKCGHDASFVADVTVEEVTDSALELLHSAPSTQFSALQRQNHQSDINFS